MFAHRVVTSDKQDKQQEYLFISVKHDEAQISVKPTGTTLTIGPLDAAAWRALQEALPASYVLVPA